jgi:hypothetical protein
MDVEVDFTYERPKEGEEGDESERFDVARIVIPWELAVILEEMLASGIRQYEKSAGDIRRWPGSPPRIDDESGDDKADL